MARLKKFLSFRPPLEIRALYDNLFSDNYGNLKDRHCNNSCDKVFALIYCKYFPYLFVKDVFKYRIKCALFFQHHTPVIFCMACGAVFIAQFFKFISVIIEDSIYMWLAHVFLAFHRWFELVNNTDGHCTISRTVTYSITNVLVWWKFTAKTTLFWQLKQLESFKCSSQFWVELLIESFKPKYPQIFSML